MTLSLPDEFAALLREIPAESAARVVLEPPHVVYGGAHLFKADTIAKLGAAARRAFQTYGADKVEFGALFGSLAMDVSEKVHARVASRLAAAPVADYRIDFEDGYGVRPDSEEDNDAVRTARELAAAANAKGLSRWIGIRIKSLSGESAARALRTLDLHLTALVATLGPSLPSGYSVTLPKVTRAVEVSVARRALEAIESKLGLPRESISLEVMVESPRLFVSGPRGTILEEVAREGGTRLRSFHFGAYDYTSELNISASDQRLAHPACDAARNAMQVVGAAYGVGISDGATTTMPIAPHKGDILSDAQIAENRSVIHHAWRLHAADVSRSLSFGIYQGWDLHPAQIPTRFGAIYTFFLRNLPSTAKRLSHFIDSAAQASRVGTAFDDAATGQGLLNFFLRGGAVGALTKSEVASSGLTPEELATRSFARILKMRAAR